MLLIEGCTSVPALVEAEDSESARSPEGVEVLVPPDVFSEAVNEEKGAARGRAACWVGARVEIETVVPREPSLIVLDRVWGRSSRHLVVVMSGLACSTLVCASKQ